MLLKKKKSSSADKSTTTKPPVKVNIQDSADSPDQDEIEPIEERMNGKMAFCDGLYPHEILVLSYAPKFCDRGNQFQGFWWYKYGIRNVQEILVSLADRGYIQRGSISDAIRMEKLPDMKEELRKRGLKISGKKEDLIDRLTENVSEEELSAVFAKRPYVLTAVGEKILKKYEWIPFIHHHDIENLDIWDLTEMMQVSPDMKYRDRIWGYLNQRGLEHTKNGDFGMYRNCRLTMSEFVAAENKPKTAFRLLCEVVAYDLSGLSNERWNDPLSIRASFYFPYERSTAVMVPGITDKLKKYSDDFGWTEDKLRGHLVEEIGCNQLPFQLFNSEECADIVISEIHKDKEKLKRIYTTAEKRFKKQYKMK